MLLTPMLLKIYQVELNFSQTSSFSTKYPSFSFLLLFKFVSILKSAGEKNCVAVDFTKGICTSKCKLLLGI